MSADKRVSEHEIEKIWCKHEGLENTDIMHIPVFYLKMTSFKAGYLAGFEAGIRWRDEQDKCSSCNEPMTEFSICIECEKHND